MTVPTVAVVTPWRNRHDLMAGYRAALDPAVIGDVNARLVIVDDASDPPVDGALVRHLEPQGFTRSCNHGLTYVQLHDFADRVVFLNSDVEPGPACDGWLRRLCDAIRPGVLAGAALRFDRHGDVDGHPYPYLDGWCVGGLVDDLVALGGFDTAYLEPAYYSDNDLCLRARAAGMELREVHVGLRHLVGQSTPTADRDRATVENARRFAELARTLAEQ